MESQEEHQAVVRCEPSESNMTISLTLLGRQRNLDRPKIEPVEKALGRIQKSAVAKPAKKQKRSEGHLPALPEVVLYDGPAGNRLVDGDTANIEAWQQGTILRVGEVAYTVVVNPPTVAQIEVYGQPMVGIPIYPNVQLLFADDASTRWHWLRKPKASAHSPRSPRSQPSSPRQAAGDGWQSTGHNARVYVPSMEDVGCLLRVTCVPARHGSADDTDKVAGPAASVTLGPVIPGPAKAPAADRHALTPRALAPPGLRVITYNILADQYASSDFARAHLFAYCPPKFMVPEYRRPLVVGELLGYHADLICLQEVDQKAFVQYFEPHLSYVGYDGHYTNKAGKTAEGSATFYRRDRFRAVAQRDINLRALFAGLLEGKADAGRHAHFLPMLQSSPALAHALQKVGTIAQATILVPCHPSPMDQPICLINTHLFFHSRAPHIRTMHTAAIMHEAQQLIDEVAASTELAAELGGLSPAVIFCGDLNSDLNDGIPGAVELLRTGALPADYWDWSYGANFAFNRSTDIDPEVAPSEEDEEMAEAGAHASTSASVPQPGNAAPQQTLQVQQRAKGSQPAAAANTATNGAGPQQQQQQQQPPQLLGVDLRLPVSLSSADGLQSKFTNYVKGYQGLLDYVWYDQRRMRVTRSLGLPEESELQGWIPSERFPSDHLSVGFDLEWLPQSTSDSAAPHLHGQQSSDHDGAALQPPQHAQRLLPAALEHVGRAVAALGSDDVIALPSDTLYGLAASGSSAAGVQRIYAIKRRQAHLMLAICVADREDVGVYGETGHLPAGLLADLLPGPVTVVLRRRTDSPLTPHLNPGAETIGIRIPDADFIREVCRQHRCALALTSANISGQTSPIAVSDFEQLWDQCAAVFDGGQLQAGREGSTLVDLSCVGGFRVIRAGSAHASVSQLLTTKYGLQQLP